MSGQQILSRPAAQPDSFVTGAVTGPSSAEAGRPYRRFFFWLFLIPVVLYVTAIPMVRMPSYESWGPSHWGPILDFAWKTEGINADMVLFGDSSAFLGIDPRLVDQQLPIKSVVLPNTVGSLPVNGDQALEYYLAHNRRPRLIVLYFAAWDLDYSHSGETHLYEGEEMLLRHDTVAQIARFALQHPLEIPAFPLRIYSTVGPTVLKTLLHGEDREAQTAAALGHVDDHEDYPAMTADCTLPERLLSPSKADSVHALVQKYKARGYNVLVYLAPLPACANSEHFIGETFNGLALAPPVALPSPFFKQDGLFAHAMPAAVPQVTQSFIDNVRRYPGLQLEHASPVPPVTTRQPNRDAVPALRRAGLQHEPAHRQEPSSR